jgi:hypothetical protein
MIFKAFKHVNYYLYAERSFYESTAVNLSHYVCYVSFSAVFVLLFTKFDLVISKIKARENEKAGN